MPRRQKQGRRSRLTRPLDFAVRLAETLLTHRSRLARHRLRGAALFLERSKLLDGDTNIVAELNPDEIARRREEANRWARLKAERQAQAREDAVNARRRAAEARQRAAEATTAAEVAAAEAEAEAAVAEAEAEKGDDADDDEGRNEDACCACA